MECLVQQHLDVLAYLEPLRIGDNGKQRWASFFSICTMEEKDITH